MSAAAIRACWNTSSAGWTALSDADGALAWSDSHNLDLVQPANLLLFLYEQTGEARYLTAAVAVADTLLADYPRTAEGGFWHKDIYPQQMWLDGIYMAGPFLARLGALTGEPRYGDTAAQQALLLASHAQDPATGLLRHAWDASGAAVWAEAETGLAPVVWSRGMGWYAMALVDILQALPADHPGRDALLDVFQRAAAGLAAAQDPASGLWFQVLDQPTLPGNWIETSGSAMIVYALQTGVDAGLLDVRYGAVAARGWQGLAGASQPRRRRRAAGGRRGRRHGRAGRCRSLSGQTTADQLTARPVRRAAGRQRDGKGVGYVRRDDDPRHDTASNGAGVSAQFLLLYR